jgi:hypothetical protein
MGMVFLYEFDPFGEGFGDSLHFYDVTREQNGQTLAEVVTGYFTVMVPSQFSNQGGEVHDVFVELVPFHFKGL